ncbi:Oidioi.mRNA.OKI2018_I69.PAR.g9783.t1.cds [Oikopleura dioica]|uniref:Oidioi.mRNA.OKI2018_I69.PAR.g9783.t1.cds n=1 Tax=Oikopleura dioica TaxID=34765 RepID=A0ABN7RM88_OIKDI|nr:Oidioi.mRNA.OKI2018_I69.PAR.g9783.t1.cds [Oikopleura dioica]
MRLFATIAAFALAQDETSCGPNELDFEGFCLERTPENLSWAQEIMSLSDGDGIERTKRRSQRMTMILAKVNFDTMFDENGEKLRPKRFIERINEYGCYCWARAEDKLNGYGTPLDALDSSCQALSKCHTCIKLDYSEETCNPHTTKYKAKLTRNNGTMEVECTNKMNKKETNNGDCKRDLCECDKAFADNFAKGSKTKKKFLTKKSKIRLDIIFET